MPIRILLAEDHEIIRTGLRSIIEKEGDMEVVAEMSDTMGIIDLIRFTQPDIVIMGIDKTGTKSTEEIQRVIGIWPEMRLICMSLYATRILSREILKAGAMGYLVKHRAFEELVSAIRCVMAGNVWK
ncbi:MAG: response regulator transcription factor [Proteobacteria bacterium]|jgi:DNA-binding NarL/FixJ family response regulator|nr:response regulator transcription factor [Pseudomonadota bacterium]